MRKVQCTVAIVTVALLAIVLQPFGIGAITTAEEKKSETRSATQPDAAAVERSRKTVKTLDNIFKQTIVLVTDKYVHDEDDFAAGSAAVLLFKNISESGDNKVRLIDATGEPYEPENVAKDKFEKAGIKRLKAGADSHEQIVTEDGKPLLRVMTSVPVVMQKCVMCHPHYADAKEGEPIGAISYTVPIE
ncbi:DUF3365 domain-containing protein [bacterium]|nr:DUF3365 domain-containing protein [bacterium]